MVKNVTCIGLGLLLLQVVVGAQDDYHLKLRQELLSRYGIADGTWVLPESEAETNASGITANVDVRIYPSPEEMSFSSLLHVDVERKRLQAWDNRLRFYTVSPIKKGDILLLVLWSHHNESSSRYPVTLAFEKSESPQNKSLYLKTSFPAGWRQWMVPFKADHDYPAAKAYLQINLGQMQGSLNLAGIAMLNLHHSTNLDQVPSSMHHLDYEGREENALWRRQALQRIENIRKGTFKLKIVNMFQEPIQGVEISLEQHQHEFGFGSAVSSQMWYEESLDSPIYLEKCLDLTGDGRSFNIVTLKNALKWKAWETPYEFGTKEQTAQVVSWFAERGVRVRGHNLIWPKWQYLPADLQQNQHDLDYLEKRIKDHIFEKVRYQGIKDHIQEWDVVNELRTCRDLTTAFGSPHVISDWLQWTSIVSPSAQLYLNENHIIAQNPANDTARANLKNILDLLKADNAPIHGIGIQAHMDTDLTPPQEVLAILDEFNDYNLNVSITEYDAVNVHQDVAADYMRDLLIAVFSHPSTTNFIMWGFWDGAHWKGNAPLFRSDWSLKPSGEVFIQKIFHDWWSRDSGITGKEGRFSSSVFYGTYNVVVNFDGHLVERQIRFTRRSPEIILQLDTDQMTLDIPDFFHLDQNHPNPFNHSTLIRYAVPIRADVSLELYSLRGRCLKSWLFHQQAAGWHQHSIVADDLPSGVYYYRLRAGQFQATRKMLLVR